MSIQISEVLLLPTVQSKGSWQSGITSIYTITKKAIPLLTLVN